ncbi:efflux RND transporter periplasmic adaptor subunit [Pontixanthobacter gangjinensis]|uniref:Efflux RND transporter periplasmic adaptor subunit n=1 Tax=Pontixanthobacter gangjinensis TaxID=1028742 RepID=A0A6I4SLD6_9SPHN|nr:efflux RND transporter periplasmic adaptor subunit [Pontixanthobacter gangjinensis]MXO55617.1 efflux RND transporter periplasmic adaptor subunit [Pontixanthobacter gangjinensis]
MNYETTVQADNPADGGAWSGAEDALDNEVSSKTGKRKLIIGLIIIGLIAALGFAYYQVSNSATAVGAGDDQAEQAASVTIIKPGRATIAGEIQATGTVAARRELPVGIAGEGGRVVSVPVDAGDWVKAGQVLAFIDRSVQNQQVDSAAAQVNVAQADANLAQANLDRALKLVDRGFISKADVDRLTATRDAAVARVRVANAQVRETRARNARLNIVAPSSGLVLERMVEPGQIVSAGSGALFRIAQGGEMEMMARLNEVDLAKISAGVQATITPTGSQKSFAGQIWQISPIIDAQDRQGTARIALPYAPELRPGGFAQATISSGTVVAPMLPESAVLSDDKGSYVFIIDKDNKAQRRDVTTGMVTQDGIAIASGLDGTESIVLRAGGFLTPGEVVNPKLAKTDGK